MSETSNGFTDGQATISCLKEDAQYRFLGAPERLLQEEKLALDTAARAYLQRISVTWSSPLSEKNKNGYQPACVAGVVISHVVAAMVCN